MNALSLALVQASTLAGPVDLFQIALLGLAILFTTLTAVLLVLLAVVFRVRSEDGAAPAIAPEDHRIEALLGGLLFSMALAVLAWGGKLAYDQRATPADAMEITVVGKQWVWKVQHPGGKREINELHVPVGQPVQLSMTSEDSLHTLSIPAFRVQQDVRPGHYTKVWFEATVPGVYPLFSPGYSGADNAKMNGLVYALAPTEYERWRRGAGAAAETPVEAGTRLYTQLGCATCHNAGPAQLGPSLNGIYGHLVKLTDGTEVLVDDAYLQESILNSQAKVVAGYQPVMPVFKGMISEDQLANLLAYIKSLTPPADQPK